MFVLDLSQIMKVTGTCVVRGRDWKWGDQDGTGAGGGATHLIPCASLLK